MTNQLLTEEDSDISKRDFTGLDFSAWAYDLFNANEPYQNRGIHRSGVGIDRYIKPSDLTADQIKYLKKQGYLQIINMASPMLFGLDNSFKINSLNLNWNFAVRHILTSFGHDITPSIFIKTTQYNGVFHKCKVQGIFIF